MRAISQTLTLIAVAAITLSCSACGRLSNNTGKIEGKWQLVSCSRATPAENSAIQSGMANLVFEFFADGRATLAAITPYSIETENGRYSLLVEDFVQLSDFPAQKGGMLGAVWGKNNIRVTIHGDQMKMMTLDETFEFKRVK